MTTKVSVDTAALIPQETIENKIFFLRGKKVMIDSDLAMLYKVEVKQLKRSVRRNISRFPDDFMFQLSPIEYQSLRCQFGTLKRGGTLNISHLLLLNKALPCFPVC